ncbi:D-alanyl-D-alanine carboxypeptidase family protein [Tindallia californiensis]|uniref:D-alanyl-D-alanine carboxypeptidase family protein n=1 Tax=Tindallia californiensis TaxID=159292 RepID=UPI00241CCEB0|nr:D-alanyl-D-alanine carboxypeptidase family protein [Tindallia californiensis]
MCFPLTVNASELPEISAPRAILMDEVTGEVIFEKNAHEPTYPASTTKILTAIVALENAELDEMIYVDYEPGVPGSSMYILPGESFTVETLVQALMIRSGNDVAEVLANHISGSVESFVDLMNKKALEIGAKNTYFTNPHGLPDEDHLTTAYDLALISRYAMRNPTFREIVSSPSLVIPETKETPEQRIYNNSNRFLWGRGTSHQMLYQGEWINLYYPRVDGIKTGFTNAAKHCLVSSATDNDRQVIAVVLNAERENLYPDSRALLDHGLDNYQLVTLTDEKMLITSVPIVNGTHDNIALFTEKAVHTILPTTVSADFISKEIKIKDVYEAPIEANIELGEIVFYHNDRVIGNTSLIAMESVEFLPFFKRIPITAILLSLVLFLFIAWQIYVFRVRKIRRQAYLRRRMERYQ